MGVLAGRRRGFIQQDAFGEAAGRGRKRRQSKAGQVEVL